MKKTMSALTIGLICLVGTYAAAGTARQDTEKRLQSSVDVLQSIMSTPDKGIPEEVLSNAKCILVVPDLIKGGFILGANTDVAWPLAVPLMVGALLPLSPLAAEVGDCRSALKVSTWLCWS